MLQGKVVLLTGASRGIGVYIASALIKSGAIVLGVARSEEGLTLTKKQMENNHQFIPIAFDLTQTKKLQELLNKINEVSPGPVDIIVHNAGLERYQFFQHLSSDDIHNIINTNLLAPIELTRLLLPQLLQRGGHIVSIASLAGKKGVIYNSPYSATKGGLILWTDAMRQELAGTKVNISVICPGYISEAGMFHNSHVKPPALLGTSHPQKVAQAVIDAIIENKPEIIVNSGPIKPLLILAQLFPRLGDLVVKWMGIKNLNLLRME